MVCETHLTTYINLYLEAIIALAGVFSVESLIQGIKFTRKCRGYNISPPLIEIDSSPDEYLFYKAAIIKLKLQPLGRILFQVYRKH